MTVAAAIRRAKTCVSDARGRHPAPGTAVAAPDCMLLVLVVAAFVWAMLLLAVCAVCAVGGAADEQSEKWYHESRSAAEDVDQQERGAA